MLKAVCLWIVLIYVGLYCSYALASAAAYEIDKIIIFGLGAFVTIIISAGIAYNVSQD
jgi:hypothetical protein